MNAKHIRRPADRDRARSVRHGRQTAFRDHIRRASANVAGYTGVSVDQALKQARTIMDKAVGDADRTVSQALVVARRVFDAMPTLRSPGSRSGRLPSERRRPKGGR